MRPIDNWIKQNATLFVETHSGNVFAALYAPHLNRSFPWLFYCCKGELSGDYRCYKTREDAEDQINKQIANMGGILLEKESL